MKVRSLVLVNPRSGRQVVLVQALGEPKTDLVLGRLDRVGTVADVTTNVDGVLETDGTRSRVRGLGRTEDGTTGLDDITTLPDHGDHGARVHVLDQSREEGLLLEVSVVLLEVLLARGDHLEGDELRTTIQTSISIATEEAGTAASASP